MTAYATIEQANQYHAARTSASAWSLVSNKEALLLVASDYIDVAYSFAGQKTGSMQQRQFPRNGSQDIPWQVMHAACVLALIGNEVDLMGNTERDEKRVTVGEITVEYDGSNTFSWGDGRNRYVDMLLRDLLASANLGIGSGRLIRG